MNIATPKYTPINRLSSSPTNSTQAVSQAVSHPVSQAAVSDTMVLGGPTGDRERAETTFRAGQLDALARGVIGATNVVGLATMIGAFTFAAPVAFGATMCLGVSAIVAGCLGGVEIKKASDRALESAIKEPSASPLGDVLDSSNNRGKIDLVAPRWVDIASSQSASPVSDVLDPSNNRGKIDLVAPRWVDPVSSQPADLGWILAGDTPR